MKRHTRDTIRALVRLVEDDVTELRDAVAQVDERSSDVSRRSLDAVEHLAERTAASIIRLDERLADVEAYLAAFDHDPHSRKV